MKKKMTRDITLRHEFVEFIPDDLQEGIIYISIAFATAVHKCCCGCGKEVVTPLSPTDWKLIFDGETISLSPSIGNWGFDCRSHYWITRNRAKWARQWSNKEIQRGRTYDRRAKERYFDSSETLMETETKGNAVPVQERKANTKIKRRPKG
jgi:hypothetical protein